MVCIVKTDDDILFNFDDNEDVIQNEEIDAQKILEERFKNLKGIDFLWRCISSKNYRKFYNLRLIDEAVSLFKMKLVKDVSFCESDLFLQFFFYIVSNKDTGKDSVKNLRAGCLNIQQALQLAYTDEVFGTKIEYIRVTKKRKQTPKYKKYAKHWDLKYVKREYAQDDDIAKLLNHCTELIEPTSDFPYEKVI